MGKLKPSVSFLTTPHCQLRGVGQGMKQTYLYLWYPLFQVQWDRCDQRNNLVIVLCNEKLNLKLKLLHAHNFFSPT